jgi:hypothetical protein
MYFEEGKTLQHMFKDVAKDKEWSYFIKYQVFSRKSFCMCFFKRELNKVHLYSVMSGNSGGAPAGDLTEERQVLALVFRR